MIGCSRDRRDLGGKMPCRSNKTTCRCCWKSTAVFSLLIRHVAPLPLFLSLLQILQHTTNYIQVQKQRLQKANYPRCFKHTAQAADHQVPATAPQALPPASPEGPLLTSPVWLSHAITPAEDSSEAGTTPHDCKTPHHSMLPAPGANMLSGAGHANPASTLQTAGPCSGQEDPIVVTAGQRQQRGNSSMPARRKPGSKTWNTLSFQQATHAAAPSQASMATNPSHATSAAPATVDAMHQHHYLHEGEGGAAPYPPHDATGSPLAPLQQGKRQHPTQTQHNQGRQSPASVPSSPPCLPASCGVGELCASHALQPAQAASTNSQPCEAAAAHMCMALEGSET